MTLVPFPYPGSKARLVKKLLHDEVYPRHRHYVSVFGGSGSDLIFKPMSKVETYNDKSKALSNVFRCLTDDAARARLKEKLKYKLHSQDYWEWIRDQVKHPPTEPDWDARIEWAFAYITLGQLGNAHNAPGTLRNCARSSVVIKGGWSRRTREFDADGFAERFRDVNVECLDWRDILAKYDRPYTLFFCDPPYHPSTIQGDFYEHDLSVDEHDELCDRLRQVRGTVMLCGYDNVAYRKKLKDWRVREWETTAHLNVKAKTKSKRKEIVWIKTNLPLSRDMTA